MTMQQLAASANPETIINENFASLDAFAVYGKRQAASTGLTWAYYGGIWGSMVIADGSVTLTNASTNYIVANRGTGAVTVATSTTNWDDRSGYARIAKVTTVGGVATAQEDHRAGERGTHGPQQRDFYGTAAPGSGTYARGDRVWNTTPAAAGYVGWVCVTAGTPGTWKGFGAIEA